MQKRNYQAGVINQAFPVDEVIIMLEKNTVHWHNENLVQKLEELSELLKEALTVNKGTG